MTESDALIALRHKLGRSWKYREKTLFFKELRNVPAGRYTIYTDSMTLSFYRSQLPEFVTSLTEVSTELSPKRMPRPVAVPKLVREPEPKIESNQRFKDIITMDIKESRNYDKFTTITGNRDLDQRKIKTIVTDVNDGFNMLPFFPIIVSNKGSKLMIIDGQHRCEVSKLTNNPVYYLECDDLPLQRIAQLNSRGAKWKPDDFLNCYIKLEVADYIHVRDISMKYGLSVLITADLLMTGGKRHRVTEDFQAGKFKCRYLKETVEVMDLMTDLFGQTSFRTDRYCIQAVQKIMAFGACDFLKLKSKLESNIPMLQRQTDAKKYCQLIETIYNVNAHKRLTIY